MKLVDDIIELAVDDAVRLPIILRKCLVVATRLKNDRLKGWVLGELNGYSDRKALPQYRVLRVQAKGLFLGSWEAAFQSQLHEAMDGGDQVLDGNGLFRGLVGRGLEG